jgi:hypothetical protein
MRCRSLRSASLLSATLAWVAASALAGCSDGAAPFGGPHGGEWNPPSPSAGPPDGAAGDDASGDDSGGGSSGGGPAPTWTEIYNLYLVAGKIGDCTDTNILCHSQYNTPSAMYGYLMTQSQLGTNPPALTDPNRSCLTWYAGPNDTVGNLMPLTGNPKSAQAVTDMNAWAAAGAPNN